MKPWAAGDLLSVCRALAYAPIGLMLNPGYRSPAGLGMLLATGLSLGTLPLIVIDPLRQIFGCTDSLLTIALDEGRTTLWWSAAIAMIYLVKDLFVPPPPPTT